jgi:hypothetical protein
VLFEVILLTDNIVRITVFLDFVHRPVFQKLEKATFRKLDVSEMLCFLVSGIPDDGQRPKPQ